MSMLPSDGKANELAGTYPGDVGNEIHRLAEALSSSSVLHDAEASIILPDQVEALKFQGVSHTHYRLHGITLCGKKVVARVPRRSEFGHEPNAALEYQSAAFQRLFPSGHVPELLDSLSPSPLLPRGALLVEENEGRLARLPDAMPAIAAALAAIHRLPLPSPTSRGPLQNPDRPLDAIRDLVLQRSFPANAHFIARDVREMLLQQIGALDLIVLPSKQAVRAIAFDSHHGNFLIDSCGRAIFVDLEKVSYSNPALDLAHASLATSTVWAGGRDCVLSDTEMVAFYRAYLDCCDPFLREHVKPSIMVARRLIWLRTLTWMARMGVERIAMIGDDAAETDAVMGRITQLFERAFVTKIAEGLGTNL